MVGPHRRVKGGIPSVVNSYYESSLVDNYDLRYVISHVDGSKYMKLLQAVIGLFNYLWLLITFRPHIIHIHISQDASTFRKSLFILVGSLFDKNMVVHSHASQFMSFYQKMPVFIQRYIVYALGKADVFLVVCDYWKDQFESILKDKVHVKAIFNPVVIPDWRRSFDKENSSANLLFLGRLGDRKGIYDLLAALKAIKEKHGSVFKLFAGGDGEVDKFQETVSQYNLEDEVTYLGWVGDDKKKASLKDADIYVLPSYSEGLPVSILEAMSYGLPVISTPICGIPHAVVDGVNGFLVEPGDIDGLENRLFELISDSNKRNKMGSSSFEMARDIFSVEIIVKELSEIYQALLESDHRKGI